jgi:hypothetical protein
VRIGSLFNERLNVFKTVSAFNPLWYHMSCTSGKLQHTSVREWKWELCITVKIVLLSQINDRILGTPRAPRLHFKSHWANSIREVPWPQCNWVTCWAVWRGTSQSGHLASHELICTLEQLHGAVQVVLVSGSLWHQLWDKVVRPEHVQVFFLLSCSMHNEPVHS